MVARNSIIGMEDIVFHSLFIGSTGAGKTNALLYWLLRLFTDRRDVALVLIDPHGDAAIDLVRAIPKAERERVAILDPNYVSFGLNPLSLPQGVELKERVQVLHTQVEELSALLSDVFNTDASAGSDNSHERDNCVKVGAIANERLEEAGVGELV
jgi:DNA helicase HerA-like ATPase